jgi:hypothetical protein
LLHIWILIIHFALFYYSSSYALFSILLLPLYSNSWRLSSTSQFVIIYIKMKPLTPIQHPYIRDLMVSIKVFGKLVVEPKTLGWENSRKSFENVFQKPWSSIYSNEMFSKWFWIIRVGYGKKGVGGFMKRHWCFFVVARNN